MWIFAALEAAQVIDHEVHPIRLTHGETARLGGYDDLPAVFTAAESIRREAHQEPKVSSAQAYPVLDRALDHFHGRSSSLLSHFPGLDGAHTAQR